MTSDTRGEQGEDDPIWSRQGLSLDQLTRSRLSYLLGQNAALVQQTQFADMKAGTLLALLGVLAARSAVDFSGDAGNPLVIALFAVKAALVFACLMVVAPRIPSAKAARAIAEREQFSWVALSSGIEADDYAAFMRRSQATDLVEALARCNTAMSAILKRKFSALRWAFLVALADVAGTIAAYLLIAR